MNECLTTPQHEKQIGYSSIKTDFFWMPEQRQIRMILSVKKDYKAFHTNSFFNTQIIDVIFVLWSF